MADPGDPLTHAPRPGTVASVVAVSEPISLLAGPERVAELRARVADGPSWPLTPRQQGELELLVDGGFAPLSGYLGAADHASVLADATLADATPWPLPVTLDVTAAVAEAAEQAGHLALRDPEGVLLAVLAVTERFAPDRDAELRHLRHHRSRPRGRGLVAPPGARRPPGRAGDRHRGRHPLELPGPSPDPGRHPPRLGTGTGRRVLGLATPEPLHRADIRHAIAAVAGEGLADSLAEPGAAPRPPLAARG